ncbi:porin family protein [Chryseobacterium cheonjiense]|uniref:PorT family protein n=1 Tax=Chryseobacterium cheonjiense TaxID=2728845 RepID=A0A7Y0A9R2_9FLAO|nr:porin family protein [Chryseobacterium cheonjiense]NML59302.1 PorT family protein [Chryseobacterium cheonjiense]
MKKNLALAILLSVSAFFSAQDTQENITRKSDSKMSFGIKGGYSLSNMKFYNNNLDAKSFFYVGIVGEQKISSKFGVQAEILYTELGGIYYYPTLQLIGNELVQTSQTEAKYKFDQIQVPVSIKYYVIPELSVSAGMNVGINISEKVKATSIPENNIFYNYSDLKTINLFPFLGAEYKINANFFADARYHFNFIEVNSGGIPTKIGFLQAGIGYRFK